MTLWIFVVQTLALAAVSQRYFVRLGPLGALRSPAEGAAGLGIREGLLVATQSRGDFGRAGREPSWNFVVVSLSGIAASWGLIFATCELCCPQ